MAKSTESELDAVVLVGELPASEHPWRVALIRPRNESGSVEEQPTAVIFKSPGHDVRLLRAGEEALLVLDDDFQAAPKSRASKKPKGRKAPKRPRHPN